MAVHLQGPMSEDKLNQQAACISKSLCRQSEKLVKVEVAPAHSICELDATSFFLLFELSMVSW